MAESGATLTLDNVNVNSGEIVALGSATVSGTNVSGGILTLDNVTVTSGEVVAESGSTLTFDDTVTLDNTTLIGSATNDGTVKVDAGDTLTLSGVVISGGISTITAPSSSLSKPRSRLTPSMAPAAARSRSTAA